MLSLVKKLDEILPSFDRWKLVLIFFLLLIASALEVAGIGIILTFVSIVADPERIQGIPFLPSILEQLDVTTQRELLIYGSFALIGVFLVKNVYLIGLEYLKNLFIFNRFRLIAGRLFESYMCAPYTFHLNRNSAELLRNATGEAQQVASSVIKPLLDISMESITILGVVIFLLIMEPLITFAMLLILGGSGAFFLKLIKNRTQYYGKEVINARRQMIQEIQEGLGGIKDIIIVNRQSWFVNRFKRSLRIYAKAQMFRNITKVSSDRIIELITVAGMLLIAVTLVLQGRDIASTIPVLVLFGTSAIRLMPLLGKLTGDYNALRYHSYTLNTVHADLINLENKPNETMGDSTPLQKASFNNHIELQNVRYSYPGCNEPVLRDISITIPKGFAIGFAGQSGAGKSTLIDIILGLLRPTSGSILVDGNNINSIMKIWQQNIGYIPQSIYLADTTIRKNIAFGIEDKNINHDQLQAVIKTAQLEEFLNKLPEGVDTMIGERGVRLSGGQRQRIGIARALYHNPEILVMDEATSSLDNQTEKYIVDSIERLKGDRTIIIIAHRLTTIQNCNTLHVMSDGKIIASGTYEELLENNSDFKAMANISK